MRTHIFSIAFASALFALPAVSQTMSDLGQKPLSTWGIGSAQFSGITPIGVGRYALVSDKEPTDGFYMMNIAQDEQTGEITDVKLEGFKGNPSPIVDDKGISVRDCEGIVWFPSAGTLFISGEGDQAILEYALNGTPTGRRLAVPAIMAADKIYPNYGFEALAYSPEHHLFYTVTESMLRADGTAAGPLAPGATNLLRIQTFGDDLQPRASYAYRMDAGRKAKFGTTYVYGVSEVLPLPDGRLLVLEREANIPRGGIGSECICKLFEVRPSEGWTIDSSTSLQQLDPNRFLVKRLLFTVTTRMNLLQQNFANYEGMCLGRRLADGRQTILLVSDSQGGYGRGPVHLKDYVRVLIID